MPLFILFMHGPSTNTGEHPGPSFPLRMYMTAYKWDLCTFDTSAQGFDVCPSITFSKFIAILGFLWTQKTPKYIHYTSASGVTETSENSWVKRCHKVTFWWDLMIMQVTYKISVPTRSQIIFCTLIHSRFGNFENINTTIHIAVVHQIRFTVTADLLELVSKISHRS